MKIRIPLGVLLLAAYFPLIAQIADAGPDKAICKGDETSIGGEGLGIACYYWSPAAGLDDPTSPNPIASPEETTTYTLTVINVDMSSRTTDEVTVTVNQVILDLKAIPQKCCWVEGDEIKLEDFTLLTVPPNLEGEITIETPKAELPPFYFEDVMEVGFKFKCALNELETTAQIDVVNEEKVTATPADDITKPFERLGRKLKQFKFGICDAPELSLKPNVSAILGKKCCSDAGGECIRDVKGFSGAIELSAGVECEFPFFGIPKIAEAEVEIKLDVKGRVKLEGVESCTEPNICFTGDINGSLTGALEIDILDEVLLEASLGLQTSINFPIFTLCPSKESLDFEKEANRKCFFSYGVTAIGKIELFSFVSIEVKEQIIPEKCF